MGMVAIFDMYYQYQEIYNNPELDDDYSKSVRDLLKKLKEYFNSYRWVKNEIERSLWQQAGKGINISVLAARYDVNPNTLRSYASRVNHRLNATFFGESNLSAVIDSYDSELIEIVCNRVNYENEGYDFWRTFPFADKLNEIRNNAYCFGEAVCTSEDIKAVIRLLVVYDRRFFDSMLYGLNPVAISKVIDDMTADSTSETFEYYCKLKNLLFAGRNPILNKMCKKIEDNCT
jgi:hypothetical protein